MTYHCGIGGGMRALGFEPYEPHITCDAFGLVRYVHSARSYGPQAWFLKNRPAPGWSGGRRADHTREDWCPRCTAAR